jgi:hypothetical protein
MTDLVILTVDAPEITRRKKDGPGTILSRERRFLTIMRKSVAHDNRIGKAAKPSFPPCSIDAAFPGAQCTLFCYFGQDLCPTV